jgi:hypothetical protein
MGTLLCLDVQCPNSLLGAVAVCSKLLTIQYQPSRLCAAIGSHADGIKGNENLKPRIETATNGVKKMKAFLSCAAVLLAISAISVPAEAKGCLKGAAVGGIAGHEGGHHGFLGAAAGCAIGHHEANKKDRDQSR